MKVYAAKSSLLSGSDFREIHDNSRVVFAQYVTANRRQPYIRSAYFNKDKVFVNLFWQHLWRMNWRDRVRRLKYLAAGLELISESRTKPISKPNPNKSSEMLHRFAGTSREGYLFYVQIKASKGKLYLMSIFPEDI